VGEPIAADDGRPVPILSVPVARAAAHPEGPLVVRVSSADEAARVGEVPPGQVVWVETTVELAGSGWPPGVGLDVLVTDPAQEAAALYAVARLRHERPLRVTIPVMPGVEKAARVAMALQLPVRLDARQPTAAAVAELGPVLEAYLHDPQATEPVEFFHSGLAHGVHGVPATLWSALERDPAFHQRVSDDGTADPHEPPHDEGFVAAHVSRLVAAGADCARCRVRGFCAGYFKWPEPEYDCGPVIGLLDELEAASGRLSRDLDEAGSVTP
jgi:hypothetical protein